jgi:hypothetical protein
MASASTDIGLSELLGGLAASTSKLPTATTPAKKRNTI